jgi:tRNA-splicing ligase RtcB
MKKQPFAHFNDEQTKTQFAEAVVQKEFIDGVLLPDAHLGYSVPIGSAILLRDVIAPAYVGYDIGCGVLAINTCIKKEFIIDNIWDIMREIKSKIPVGFNRHSDTKAIKEKTKHLLGHTELFDSLMESRGYSSFMTLGSGNHFIELGFDFAERVWVIIHSGSRGVGHAVATHFMEIAANGAKNKEGHYFFHKDSIEAKEYKKNFDLCVQYAKENRRAMADTCIEAISKYKKVEISDSREIVIDTTHNTFMETNGGFLHLKGAVHAPLGSLIAVPGNMKDGTFIVRGRGCEDTLSCCSHGAGRTLSRGQAKKAVDVETLKNDMQDIACEITEESKDESPVAYKNIFDVIKAQEDYGVFDVVHHLTPIMNIKG